jgi:GT2 family glycosyltransferase
VVAELASVIVPSLNGAHLLPECLDSLRRQSYAPLEVIVADGASTDSTCELLAQQYPDVRLLRLRRNRGFSGNVNVGIRAARGEVVLLLNNDARAEPEWVASCVQTLREQPRLGSVASKVLYPSGRINSAGDVVGRDGIPRQRGNGLPDSDAWSQATAVFGAMGGAAAYRRAMLADVGLFDEVLFMYLEDVDLAFRAQLRGWGCSYEPRAIVYHRGGASGGGTLESFYNGRNLIRVLVKNVPSTLLPRLLPGVVAFQVHRAREALTAWRGAEARATLKGQIVGLAELPRHAADRAAVQRTRRVSDEYVWSLLMP